MRNIYALIIAFSCSAHAAYNPFFSEPPKPPVPKQIAHPPAAVVKPPKRTLLEMRFFGFVESRKGRFALVELEGNSFVVRKGDALYQGEMSFTVQRLGSNAMVLKDSYGRKQTIYFSARSEVSGVRR